MQRIDKRSEIHQHERELKRTPFCFIRILGARARCARLLPAGAFQPAASVRLFGGKRIVCALLDHGDVHYSERIHCVHIDLEKCDPVLDTGQAFTAVV